jgi:5-methylcytosine-specific restriction endonuclease McrA
MGTRPTSKGMIEYIGPPSKARDQMSKSRAAKRKEFFDCGVSAAQHVTGAEEELYLCPLCGESFDRLAIDDGRLTLEHVPSRALKGREIILTCYDCNSKKGHKLDAAAEKRTQLWELCEALSGRRGNFKGIAKLVFGGHAVTAYVDTSTAPITLIPRAHLSAPASYEAAMSYLKGHSRKGDLKFDLKPRIRLHPGRTKVADLRTAFLAAFARYGYTYALHPHLLNVRRQILEPESRILPEWWMRPREEHSEWPLIVELEQPVQGLAFYLRTGLVVLPWIGEISNPWVTLAEARGPGTQLQLSGSPRPWPRGMEMALDFSRIPTP